MASLTISLHQGRTASYPNCPLTVPFVLNFSIGLFKVTRFRARHILKTLVQAVLVAIL